MTHAVPEPIRPYSHKYWWERQRRFRLESDRRRRVRRLVGTAILAAVAAACLLIAVSRVPYDWRFQLREEGVRWFEGGR